MSRPADGAHEPLTIVLLASASSVHTSGWAAALSRAGHRVVVASLQPRAAIPGAELRVAPAEAARPAARLPLAACWLRRLVQDVQPDIVHVLSLGSYGLLSLALPRNTARVLNPYGGEFRAARRSRARAAILRQVLRRGDMVLPVSEEIRAEILHRYAIPAHRVRLLSWGVSEELIEAQPRINPGAVRAAFGIPAKATTVLSVRTTSATYRTLEIVSAFTQAAASRPDLFLIVLSGARVDSQPARQAQRAYLARVRAAARPMADRIVIMERTLSRDETFSLMCASDVIVSVPPEDQHSFSVLEAALAGPRILLSDIPPNRQLTDDGLVADLLTEPLTGVLAQALRAVRPDESARLSNRQYILSNEHGRERLAEHERLFRSLSART